MNNVIKLWKQFFSGAINGFIFGCIIELCIFLFNLIKVGGDFNSLPPIVYFVTPLHFFLGVGIGKVLACRFFRICEQHSIVSWQIVWLFSLIPLYIIGQIRVFILTTFYNVQFIGEDESSLINLIIFLLIVAAYNFFYSVVINAVFTKASKLR
ncbi:MAG TPA: hypothetical protein VF571_16410 [Pyrinomonadaceae bacterium]|jgi:hypothetical protein